MGIFDLFSLGKVPKVRAIQEPKTDIYSISLKTLDGETIDLSRFKGKKILFVNVASQCGLTPQYKGLQKLYEQEKEHLEIIGLPCNQFLSQEKGDAEQIQRFCNQNYGVSFTLTEKIKVKGDEQHPIYAWLTKRKNNGVIDSRVKWNFQKYLINEDGALQAIFSPKTIPMSDEIIKAVNS